MVEREWRIALHESGHCVIARVLGLPRCGSASIIEPDAGAYFSLDHGERSVIALMAGAAGEQVVLGDFDEIGVRIDRERWEQRLERHGYDDGGAALWDRTLALVREHLGRIQWLAMHLEYAQELDGPAIDRIVARG
jgi:hypothetical protein